MIFVFALLLLLVYMLGVRAHNARHYKPIDAWQIAFFIVGVLLIALALSTPIDELVDRSFAAHMTQHLVLAMVVPPLLLLGAPLRLALTASPAPIARRLARMLHSRVVHALTQPALAWCSFVVMMWATHFSGLYEAALENDAVHVGEHAFFLGAALLFWYPIVGIGPTTHPLSHIGRLLYVLVAMPQGAFLGLAIYGSRRVLYHNYLLISNPFGVSALEDQRIGGELMWIAGTLIMFVALLLVIANWARDDARVAQRIDTRLALATDYFLDSRFGERQP